MKVNYFDINVIDTQENTTVLSIEKTAISAPHLIYHGADDKFANIMTSELSFNFLVTDGSEGKYLDLYTGSETRFKVELVDVSVTDFPKPIWSGFLLPEQFSEPYVNNNFYVSFTATDGLGLLKNKSLFGDSKQSVLSIIGRCLQLTGLDLPLYFTEAIQNVAFNLDYKDLYVNAAAYTTDNSAYTILENCLKSIGAQVFTYGGAWYVIGLLKFKEPIFDFSKYELDIYNAVELIEKTTYTRDLINSKFFANPTITILPPLKTVTTTWDSENTDVLVPADVVTHLPVNIDADITDRTLKYWQKKGSKISSIAVWLLLLDPNFDYTTIVLNSYYNGFKATPSNSLKDVVSGPFFKMDNQGNTTTIPDLTTNFANLENPFFVYGSENLEDYGTLEINFFAYTTTYSIDYLSEFMSKKGDIDLIANNGTGKVRVTSAAHGLITGNTVLIDGVSIYAGLYKITKITDDTFDIDKPYTVPAGGKWVFKPFRENFHFAITRKDNLTSATEELYLSNFDDADVPFGFYDFEITQDKYLVRGRLRIDKLLFTDDGYYNIRLYPVVTHSLLSGLLIFDKLNFTYKTAKKQIIKQIRDIDYTGSLDVDLFHTSSRSDQTNKAFLFSDALVDAVDSGNLIPGELLLESPTITIIDHDWFSIINVIVSDSDFIRLESGYFLYVLKSSETELKYVDNELYNLINDDGVKKIRQLKVTGSDGVFIELEDVLYLKVSSPNSDLNYAGYWLDKWKRYDVDESVSFDTAINSLYHDLCYEYNYLLDGKIMNLVGPLDLVNFSFKGARQFYPLRLDIDLTEGITDVLLVESKNDTVTDYD